MQYDTSMDPISPDFDYRSWERGLGKWWYSLKGFGVIELRGTYKPGPSVLELLELGDRVQYYLNRKDDDLI